MTAKSIEHSSRPAVLTRTLDHSWVDWEKAAFALIIVISVIAHLWGLDRMAMHHDESIHAWSSWRLYAGEGGFSCWGGATSATYCYDPVYHGPSLYYLTAVAYFLFGDGDAQARLPMALAGMLATASTWWLRPYLGRTGALVAAILITCSPTLLYFTRFARHDGLMILWELWMVIGALRWIDTGRSRWLYLAAAALALAVATHELYYILFFIFGIFVLMRLLAESRLARYLNAFLIGVIGICLSLMIFNPRIPVGQGLYFGEKAFLVASAFLLAWLCQRLWPPEPILTPRLRQLWSEQRSSLWVALAILGAIYLTLYSSFFAYMPGAIDGLYAGLAYWLGSQQDYARGDQPWYYYLIQLPLYDPLAVVASIGTVIAMLAVVVNYTVRRQLAVRSAAAKAAAETPPAAVEPPTQPLLRPWALYPLLIVFWFWTALIIFSWAGEKMPWLVVHMSLPGNLLAAWVIARLVRVARGADPNTLGVEAPSTSGPGPRIWIVPVLSLLIGVAVSVAIWRLSTNGSGQQVQRDLLQGLLPLLLAGGMIYWLLTLSSQLGSRIVLAATGLTLVVGLGAYTLRSSALAVYTHPDTPIELLVYTQTAPNVTRYVADIRELAINLTRGERSDADVAGGLRMPVIIDGGGDSGEGSLAWPLQWYFRDFQRVTWMRRDLLQTNPSLQTFEVEMPNGSTEPAPVVLLYKPHVTEAVRSVLSTTYVQPYGNTGVFNWWFPEGDKCSPQSPGYKRFYYSSWTPREELVGPADGGVGVCGRDISSEVHGPFAVLLWPFQPDNWTVMSQFLLYRRLPATLVPGAREMEFWLRADLANGVSSEPIVPDATELRLIAQSELPLPADGAGPTGAVVDAEGRLYIAATDSHRIDIFNSQGELERSLGGFGSELGQFYEPRGMALDAEGNLYVADTWNARIVKFDATGQAVSSWGSGSQDLADGRRATITDGDRARNEANPLGFFGPRGVAVDTKGNVYIADTGNKRVVVTDSEGEFLYQFGSAGSAPGQFNEPTSLAVDAQGVLYVADTWNGRVQIFAPDGTDRLNATPIVTWNVRGWRPNTYDDPAIAVGADNTIYVSVPDRNQVVAFNFNGTPILRWGGPGNDLASLSSPSGIVLTPDGAVWVVDRALDRVLRFVLPAIRPS